MKCGNPVETLAAALYGACHRDLLPMEHEEWEFGHDETTNRPTKNLTGRMKQVRPDPHHCSVTMFEQGWGSTALGFGGIGGQAVTSAYTVVVEGPVGDVCVYFGARLAYHIKRPNQQFWEDVNGRLMHKVAGAQIRYEREEIKQQPEQTTND